MTSGVSIHIDVRHWTSSDYCSSFLFERSGMISSGTRCLLLQFLHMLLLFTGVVGDVTGLETPPPPFVVPNASVVFWEGLLGSACFRIPAIIETHKVSFHTFACYAKPLPLVPFVHSPVCPDTHCARAYTAHASQSATHTFPARALSWPSPSTESTRATTRATIAWCCVGALTKAAPGVRSSR